jgi:hypothetical protein
MRQVLCTTLIGLALLSGGVLMAQPPSGNPAARDAAKPAHESPAEMIFADGSTVRVALLTADIELETKYGKLTIPAADVQRVEFAFRLPDELSRQIAAAVKQLGDASFEVREAATKALRTIGRRAYPGLEAAARSGDAEVARRATMLVEELRQKVSADDLTFPKQDRIQTAEFTVTGRITAPVLRARTEYFGETNLKLMDLRVFQAGEAAGETRVSIDAARHGSAPNQWLETSIRLERGAPLKVVASGQVDLWPPQPGQYMTTPKGYGNAQPPAFSAGSLVGKVGQNGTPFLIGDRYDGKAAASGKLYLHIIPSHWGNPSSGTYEVKVSASER